MSHKIKEKLDGQLILLPNRPGVYKFLDIDGEVLYIGKALSLRARVSSYFRDQHFDRPHIIPMIDQIEDIEYIETEGEVEALVLESALIKQYQPKYNVLQKDGKSYAYIYIPTMDPFPSVKVVRAINRDDYKRGRLFGPYPSGRAVMQVFRYIRKLYPFCTCKSPKEPCLYYHMGLCNGPHFGDVTREQYMESIGEIIKFLQGKRKRHIGEMEQKMKSLAAQQQYESAAQIRDKIADLRHLGLKIRADYEMDEQQYNTERSKLIYGENKSLAQQLGVEKLNRIECYDISNIQGKSAYGSMVVAIDGERDSSHYRIFKIRSKDTPDDFGMLAEVLQRRMSYLDKGGDDNSLSQKPDLILIDGGKGQVGKVLPYISDDVLLMGISKGRHLKKQGKRKTDQFWIVNADGETEAIHLRRPRILIDLRDEAHRFALKHHRKSRKFNTIKSKLDEIPGIGPKKKKALMIKYGGLKAIAAADLAELVTVVGNKKLAETIVQELNKISETIKKIT